ncbi:MAG: pyridoxamine 5'-phosphate oxidase family protein [Acidimicrobiia bacterium]|nr:pyridoxamine 5'-phosphate oxidase family protein [Acidimicrobiia bacterium]
MSSDRTTVRRLPERARYDRETIDAIIDAAFVCHVGFVDDEGRPVVIPTIHARQGDRLHVHGAPASRMLRTVGTGVPICVTVTHVDGVVVARAPFHMSLNYRSVVVFGEAERLRDRDRKREALRVITEHVTPGRWDDSRRPTQAEIDATTVLSLPIAEASAKVRTGPPKDDEEDYALDLWAGVIPLDLVPGEPIPDPRLPEGVEFPPYLRAVGRSHAPEA